MHKQLLALALCLVIIAGIMSPALAAEETADPALTTEETEDPALTSGETEDPALTSEETEDSALTSKETEDSALTAGETSDAAPAGEDTADPAEDAAAVLKIYVDGVPFVSEYTTIINQTTYVSFTLLTQFMRPQAVVAWENGGPVARDEGLELSARPGSLYLYANGRYLYIPGTVQLDPTGTVVLVPVRTLAQALGASVEWNGTVQLTSGAAPLVPGDEFYNDTDVSLLSHIINYESGNQPLKGKIAVGNVLLNRVNNSIFPSTLYDVVYQAGQFNPSGSMARTPNTESVIAAKLCLEGAMVVPGAYWFNGVGKSCWASRHKACLAVIGGHAFYG